MKRAILAVACALVCAAPAQAAELDLETLDGPAAIKLMDEGKLTSVELTRAYIARIAALNKSGPGLNAVSQLNEDALQDAALLDKERREGKVRGPAHGLPVLLKDLIDVKGMYTSAGNFSLRNSFPAIDSGVAKHLRERGVVILGKLGLSEYANYFGNQPSGFANLTGQVLNGLDADQNPSGSSSGSGSASAAALSMLIVGTETSGSIISPSQANGLVGLRPTVGLVPGYGIAPISASQDTAGPMDRTVANAALTLQSIAGYDAHNADYYRGNLGPGRPRLGDHPAGPGNGPELPVGARPELRARQADRLERHGRPDQRGQGGAGSGRRDPRRAPEHQPRHPARRRAGLRGQARHRRLLPPPRPGRADQDRRAGDGRQPGQRARGAEVRQRHARERVRDRHQPALGGLDRLSQRRAAWASSSRTPASTG